MARPDDDDGLIRLAALDGARPLEGPAVVAEENGAIVAALSVSSGRAVADPFVPALHHVELLRRYAAGGHSRATAPRDRRLLPRLVLRSAER
jgi:hypothetical protein